MKTHHYAFLTAFFILLLISGLFGRIGIGKTSLINSMKFAVSGRVSRVPWLPVATLEKAGGHTLCPVIGTLTGNISVIDNRGFFDLTKDETVKKFKAQWGMENVTFF